MELQQAKDFNKFIAHYAKAYQGGQFSAPLPSELLANPGSVVRGKGVVAIQKHLPKGSTRKDFTGRPYSLFGGSTVLTHLARSPGAALPAWIKNYSYLYTYVEDLELSKQLQESGWVVKAYRVSATSEILGCWCKADEPRIPIALADTRTFTQLSIQAPVKDFIQELKAVDCWHDDFPYYSDGTWSAVSLRGYKADDPRWGVKPSEMPPKWLAEHPEAKDLTCGWTVLSKQTPSIKAWVESVPGWTSLERVRLFKMAQHKTLDGKLGRHSDIQDKAVGTKNGCLARFHVPLITHPNITMTAWGLNGIPTTAHLAAGGVYYLDTRKPHAVNNQAPIDRVHLVVDVVVNAEVRHQIENSLELH